jgi:hypothetical protein
MNVAKSLVLLRELAHELGHLILGKGLGNVHVALEPERRRDVAEEVFDRLDAYRLQHLLPILVGVW